MKVCMISGSYPAMPCGVGDYTAHLAGELARAGVGVDVLACSHPQVEPRRNGSVDVFPVLGVIPALDARRISTHARERGCDLIHIQYPTWAFRRSLSIPLLPGLLRLMQRRPVVVTMHEVSHCHPLNRLRLIPIAYSASAVTATTEEDSRWLATRLPGLGKRIAHIPIGAFIEPSLRPDYDRIRQRRELGITDDEIAVCHFGFVLRNKLLEHLLPAARAAIDSGARIRLVFMSGFERTEGEYGAQIRQMIRELGLSQHVSETGYVQPGDVSRFISACDIAVLLFRDGASFRRSSMLTVMAHGLPVISYRGATPPAGLRDADNIVLVETDDIAGIADRMLKLCNDAHLRRRIGEAGRKTADAFSWPSIARRTAELYQRLLR